jgi:lysophospholipase L1-like esterase
MRRGQSLSVAVLSVAVLCGWSRGAGTGEKPHAFENEIAAFERADAVQPPPRGAILFIGSSTVRLWTSLAADLPNHRVINRGFGGSQIADSTYFAPRVIFPYAPRAIYLRAGGNDLWAGKSVAQVFADFKEFVSTIQAKLPETDIVYVSLNPSISRWRQAGVTKELNDLIAGFVKGKPHLRYIETYDIALDADGKPRPELFVKDQLHFSAEGYKLLAARVRPDLEKTYPADMTSR